MEVPLSSRDLWWSAALSGITDTSAASVARSLLWAHSGSYMGRGGTDARHRRTYAAGHSGVAALKLVRQPYLLAYQFLSSGL